MVEHACACGFPLPLQKSMPLPALTLVCRTPMLSPPLPYPDPCPVPAVEDASVVPASTPGHEPSIYSCPSSEHEYPGLIKFAVHQGLPIPTADARTFAPHEAYTVQPVKDWLSKHVPFVDPVPVMADTCLYTMTPDEDFIVDFAPGNKNIIVAAGFSGHGFKFGALIGRILADLASSAASTGYDISHFRIDRPALKGKGAAEGTSAAGGSGSGAEGEAAVAAST